MINIFDHLELHNLMQLRQISHKWDRIVREDPQLLRHLDLSMYNRKVNDTTIREVIAPFVGSRPLTIDISNCFHLSDEGFTTLASICGANVRTWRMKSVWEVSAVAIHEMVKSAPNLSNIDLSNCRKVNDALLMHVIGNIPLSVLNISSAKIFSYSVNQRSKKFLNASVPCRGTVQIVFNAEYGMGGVPSKEGDVYSFGILVLELFSGRTVGE